MNRAAFLGAIAAIIVANVATVRAAVVYDNGPPNHDDGRDLTASVEADDFTLGSTTRVENFTFWDLEVTGNFAGSIVWEIYANGDDQTPGTLLYSATSTNLTHVGTGFTLFVVYHEFVITFQIPPVVLSPGTYWLSLHNGPLTNNSNPNAMFWESTNTAGLRPSRTKPAPFTGPWLSNEFPGVPSEFAFQVNGVPGPTVTAISFVGTNPAISFTTTAGQTYRVEFKNNLTDGSWTPLPGSEMVAGTGNAVQVKDLDPNIANVLHRFYRAVLL